MDEPGPDERAAAIAPLGLDGRCSADDAERLRGARAHDADPRVRTAAIGALVRSAPRARVPSAWVDAAEDDDASVRRRAAEVARALGRRVPGRALPARLDDTDTSVAEAAAFGLG